MTNTTPHRATPEQWAHLEAGACHTAPWNSARVVLELRDRLAAAEERICELEGSRQGILYNSFSAESLVEMVAAAVTASFENGPYAEGANRWDALAARAAILACAQYLEEETDVGAGRAAGRWLRQEVERHG